MEHKKFAVVILAAVIASLMLAGTILAPIQSYAAAKRGSETDFPDTSSLKHAVRDGVSANLSHRDQHLNQQNLCYRTNTCRQSDVGQNTQGNDNQVTGFADQSDNIPQAVAPTPVTPGNQTSANTNTTSTTPGGTTVNNFINNSTTLFSLCSLFQVENTTGGPGTTTSTQTGTVTCTVTLTDSPGAIGIGGTIAASDIIPRPANGVCPAGFLSGVVTLPNGTTINVCIRAPVAG